MSKTTMNIAVPANMDPVPEEEWTYDDLIGRRFRSTYRGQKGHQTFHIVSDCHRKPVVLRENSSDRAFRPDSGADFWVREFNEGRSYEVYTDAGWVSTKPKPERPTAAPGVKYDYADYVTLVTDQTDEYNCLVAINTATGKRVNAFRRGEAIPSWFENVRGPE